LPLVFKFVGLVFLAVNFFHLFFEVFVIEPSNTLAFFPEAGPLDLGYVLVDALAVLLTIFPLTSILSAILPSVDAEALLFVSVVLAFVPPTIWPGEYSLAMHIIIFPLSCVNFSVRP
jgi:hypothetical protein